MEVYRCRKCNKLVFKASFKGSIEIVCTRCNFKNVYRSVEIPEVRDSAFSK